MTFAEELVTAAAQAMEAQHAAAASAAGVPAFLTADTLAPQARVAVLGALETLAAKPDGYLRNQEDGGITYTRTLRKLVEELEAGQP